MDSTSASQSAITTLSGKLTCAFVYPHRPVTQTIIPNMARIAFILTYNHNTVMEPFFVNLFPNMFE